MVIKAKDFSQAAKTLEKLKKAGENWDFKSFEQNRTTLIEEMERLQKWQELVEDVGSHLRERKVTLSLETYRQELESALKEAELPLKGNFPHYSIIPFELELVLEEEIVFLRLGRKIEKTGFFEPHALSEWVKKRYTAIVKSSFNAKSFFRDLRAAYEIGNRLTYGTLGGTKVLWGRAVDLKQIYRLLTLRQENRREYSQARFVYDLARLRAQGLIYDEYRVEFGYTKTAGGSFLIPNLATFEEERFSTVTIYYREA